MGNLNKVIEIDNQESIDINQSLDNTINGLENELGLLKPHQDRKELIDKIDRLKNLKRKFY